MSDEQDQDQDRKPILDGFLLSDSPLDGSLNLDNLKAAALRARNPSLEPSSPPVSSPESSPPSSGFVEEQISTGHGASLYSLGKMQPPKAPPSAAPMRKTVVVPTRRALSPDPGAARSAPVRQGRQAVTNLLPQSRQGGQRTPFAQVARVSVTPTAGQPRVSDASPQRTPEQETREFSVAVAPSAESRALTPASSPETDFVIAPQAFALAGKGEGAALVADEEEGWAPLWPSADKALAVENAGDGLFGGTIGAAPAAAAVKERPLAEAAAGEAPRVEATAGEAPLVAASPEHSTLVDAAAGERPRAEASAFAPASDEPSLPAAITDAQTSPVGADAEECSQVEATAGEAPLVAASAKADPVPSPLAEADAAGFALEAPPGLIAPGGAPSIRVLRDMAAALLELPDPPVRAEGSPLAPPLPPPPPKAPPPLPSLAETAQETPAPHATPETIPMSLAELPPLQGPAQAAPSEHISPLDGAAAPAGATPPAAAPPGEDATRIPPKWGGADDGARRRPSRGLSGPDFSLDFGPSQSAGPASSGGGAGGSAGGAWLWLPKGVEPRRSWPRRHPLLTGIGLLLLAALVFYSGRISMRDSPISGPKLAVIKLEGVLLDSGPVVQFIETIAKDDAIKGALLRVNSPGGAVGPSQEIYAALKRLQKAKPVVTSMGAVAASGGYYAAIAADKVYAGPSTLTGSIGVKMSVPNMEGLLKTLGLSEKTLTTGGLKDAGSSWRAMSPEEESYLQGLLDDMYQEFLTTVANERSMSLDKLRPLADGRAMTGRQALVSGLVDRMGDAQDALAELKSLCKMDENADIPLVEGPEEPSSLLRDMVLSLVRSAMRERLAAEQPLFMYR